MKFFSYAALETMSDREIMGRIADGLAGRYGEAEADRRLDAAVERMEGLFAEVGKQNDGHAFLALAAYVAFRTAAEDVRKKARN